MRTSLSHQQEFRRAFYYWRQRRPLRRLLTVFLLLLVWPVRFVVQRFGRLVSGERTPKRILVLQFAGLGDTLMLTPALAALKERYPSARIDFVTLHQSVRDAFQGLALIDEMKLLPAYPGQWIISRFADLSGAGLIFATLRYYGELLLSLVWRRYDVGINFGLADFDRSLGNALIFTLDIPVRIGSTGKNQELLSAPTDGKYPHQRRVEAYLSLLHPLGISDSRLGYQFPVGVRDFAAVDRFINKSQVDSSRPLAVIHPGGKLHINSRRWPAEYFARVCAFLATKGFEIVLSGDEGDADVCAEIARGVAQAFDTAGRLSFSETGALLSRAELVITNDTSTLHLAEAMRVPHVISIFGPTDPSLIAPENERHIVFRSNLPCAPCMGGIIDANTERCWREVKEECLWQTKPEQVIGVLRTLYSKAAVRAVGA